MHCNPPFAAQRIPGLNLQFCWKRAVHAAQQSAQCVVSSPSMADVQVTGSVASAHVLFNHCCHFRMCKQVCALQVQGQSTKAQDPGAWATGIVEVALPVEYKMRNIEETEAAKRRLLHASRSAFSLMACVGQLT